MVCNLLYYLKRNTSEVDLQFLILVSMPFCKLVVQLRFLCSEEKYLCKAITNRALWETK